MSSSIHQTVSSATFLKSIQYHLCVGCHPRQQSGHLSLKQILLENKGHQETKEKGEGCRTLSVSLSFWESVGIKYSFKIFYLGHVLFFLFLVLLTLND